MADVLFVAVVIAFFALTALFVVACDRIIGPDGPPDAFDLEADRPQDEVAVR